MLPIFPFLSLKKNQASPICSFSLIISLDIDISLWTALFTWASPLPSTDINLIWVSTVITSISSGTPPLLKNAKLYRAKFLVDILYKGCLPKTSKWPEATCSSRSPCLLHWNTWGWRPPWMAERVSATRYCVSFSALSSVTGRDRMFRFCSANKYYYYTVF